VIYAIVEYLSDSGEAPILIVGNSTAAVRREAAKVKHSILKDIAEPGSVELEAVQNYPGHDATDEQIKAWLDETQESVTEAWLSMFSDTGDDDHAAVISAG
jgi:hypothetical protein